MKRILTYFAAAVLSVLPLAAAQADPAELRMETKSFPYSGFSGLQISWTYQVALTCSDTYSVRVEAPDFVMPYLDVSVSGDHLVLGVREMPKDIRKRVEMALKNKEIRAWVAMPWLTDLQMSGVSKLTATGEFSARQQDFRLSLSGATSLRGLSVEAGNAILRCSGAADFSLQGGFPKTELYLSGASKGSLSLQGREARMQLSGAVKLDLEADLNQLDVNASGAVHLDMKGGASRLGIKGSGASSLDLLGAPADNARVQLSGAANARIEVRQALDITLSGGSSCRYKAGPDFRITQQSVSRGASLTSL